LGSNPHDPPVLTLVETRPADVSIQSDPVRTPQMPQQPDDSMFLVAFLIGAVLFLGLVVIVGAVLWRFA